MEKRIISTNELIDLCAQMLANVPTYYDLEMKAAFKSAFEFGFRPAELFNNERYIYYNTEYFKFLPSKKNNIRTLPVIALDSLIRDRYINHANMFNALRVGQFDYLVKQMTQTKPIFLGEKRVLGYLFRYMRVRLMLLSLPVSEVVTYFGWTESDTINYYQNSVLYYYK